MSDELAECLERAFPGVKVTEAGGVCPLQIEGRLSGGKYFFLRFRFDDAQLYVSSRAETVGNEPELYSEVLGFTGDDLAGSLSTKETVRLFGMLHYRLAPVGPDTTTRRMRIQRLIDDLLRSSGGGI